MGASPAGAGLCCTSRWNFFQAVDEPRELAVGEGRLRIPSAPDVELRATLVTMPMAGRRVALVCIDPWSGEGNYRPFNFGARRVQASLLASGLDDLDVHFVESHEPDVDEFVERVESIDPDVVGVSTYVWSLPTFAELARRLKASKPERTVIFGGPSARPAMLSHAPFRDLDTSVDALVLGDGETLFRTIVGLEKRDRDELKALSGLGLPNGDGWVETGPPTLEDDLDDLPSPLQLGLVSSEATAHLQTFQGCPLACAFCQWGDGGPSTRIRSTDSLVAELSAIKDKGVWGAHIVDAALNLNPRAFRNLQAAEKQVGYFENATLMCEVYPSHLDDKHIELLESVKEAQIGVGLQSLDKEALRGMRRAFDERRFLRVIESLKRFSKLTVELIMGLPGDKPEAFRHTVQRVRDLGTDVRIFHCLVLPDALMTRAPAEISMRYDPMSLKMIECTGWSESAIRSAAEWLDEETSSAGGVHGPGFWTLPVADERATARRRAESIDAESRSILSKATWESTGGAWTVRDASVVDGTLLIVVDSSSGAITLEVQRSAPSTRAFCRVGALGFSYRITETGRPEAHLRSASAAIAPIAAQILGVSSHTSLPVLPG